MIEISDFISNYFIGNDSQFGSILAYFDFDIIKTIDENYIKSCVNKLIQNNPVLTNSIVEVNNKYFFKDMEEFNIDNCFSIKYISQNNFNDYISQLINKKFTEINFFILFCIDEENKKMRMYFKIHHSYVDGYKLIEMLFNSFNDDNRKYILPIFKRKPKDINPFYYSIVGTAILIINFLLIITKLSWNLLKNIFYLDKNIYYQNTSIDYIICKSIPINEIKTFTKKNNITINDFLYSLMIKTDKLYSKTNRHIFTCSPINYGNLNSQNNLLPIPNIISNSLSNNSLFKTVHNIFNYFKYSIFIPLLALLIDFLSIIFGTKLLVEIVKLLSINVDYIFTNMIGTINVPIHNLKLIDMHFLINTEKCGIVYNIVSNENDVNIIISFSKDKIKNKTKFEKCIYKAYNELINS